MLYKHFLILIVAAVLLCCKKESQTIVPQPPVTNEPKVLLKDITIPLLPSPYYYFEYDAADKVSFASFASGFWMYDIIYTSTRISEMKTNIMVNKDKLQYLYNDNGKVSTIRYADSTGIVYKRIYFTYDGDKLIKLKRERKSGSRFITEKTMAFKYYADDNLMEIEELRPSIPIPGQSNANYVDRFEQYDNKINVESFSLIHNEFFDHLVLLPGVQLQKNNPLKLIHTGDDVNYQIQYTYCYNDRNVPLTKDGAGLWLSGPNTGKPFPSNYVFTYY